MQMSVGVKIKGVRRFFPGGWGNFMMMVKKYVRLLLFLNPFCSANLIKILKPIFKNISFVV